MAAYTKDPEGATQTTEPDPDGKAINLPTKPGPGRAMISPTGELDLREGMKGKNVAGTLRHWVFTKTELTDTEKTYVERARAYCEAALKPAQARDAFTLLERLRLTKQVRNMDDDDYKIWFADFRADIQRLPTWALQLACDRYRRQTQDRFFPHCGQVLVDLVKPELRYWNEAAIAVKDLERLL